SSTERMWSVVLMFRAAYCSVSSSNSASTWCISACEMLSMSAICRLSSCTSRAGRWRSTDAALSSSSASRRMALRRTAVSGSALIILFHPVAYDPGHHGGVFFGLVPEVAEAALVAVHLAPVRPRFFDRRLRRGVALGILLVGGCRRTG